MRFYDDECEGNTDNKTTYLANRVYDTYNEKLTDLQKTFGLVDDVSPRTPREIINRLAAGKFIVNEDRMDYDHYSPIALFQWRDPSVKKDTESYKKAVEKMDTAQTEALDVIKVMSDEATRLKALKDFELKTFH